MRKLDYGARRMKNKKCYSTPAAIECLKGNKYFVKRLCELLGVKDADDLSAVEFFNQCLDDTLRDHQINFLEIQLKKLKREEK